MSFSLRFVPGARGKEISNPGGTRAAHIPRVYGKGKPNNTDESGENLKARDVHENPPKQV